MKVQAAMRPYEVFDPSSRRHREYYAEFLKTGTWGHIPIRFAVEEDCNNLAAALQRKLTEYYISKEFKLG
jgi:hypothetical protein